MASGWTCSGDETQYKESRIETQIYTRREEKQTPGTSHGSITKHNELFSRPIQTNRANKQHPGPRYAADRKPLLAPIPRCRNDSESSELLTLPGHLHRFGSMPNISIADNESFRSRGGSRGRGRRGVHPVAMDTRGTTGGSGKHRDERGSRTRDVEAIGMTENPFGGSEGRKIYSNRGRGKGGNSSDVRRDQGKGGRVREFVSDFESKNPERGGRVRELVAEFENCKNLESREGRGTHRASTGMLCALRDVPSDRDDEQNYKKPERKSGGESGKNREKPTKQLMGKREETDVKQKPQAKDSTKVIQDKEAAPSKSQRRRKNKISESETEAYLKIKANKQKLVTAYVRMEQHLAKDFDVAPFIRERMERECPFKVIKVESFNDHSVIFLEFESKNQANRALNLLKVSNNRSQMKLLCTLDKDMVKPVARDETEIKKQIAAIVKRAERAMVNHDEKITLSHHKLGTLNNGRNVTLEEFERNRIERGALQDKIVELRLQKEQFQTFLNSLVKKLKQVWEDKTYDKSIMDLRREFGVECCRLENALPMYARRNDIIQTVKDNQVAIILGETGSGKSTQMTQYLHQAGFTQDGIIVCTQPRKVAAISLATHVAQEMASSVGNVVGYKAGMKSKTGGATKIVYMTDHCLLNECLKDPTMSAYSCIIVDEAHERSIYTDLLLGMLKRCLKDRPELKAIITSATIDPDVFVDYFGGCPVLRVSGRMFPVEVVYDDVGQVLDQCVEAAVNKAIQVHIHESPGDVLVFVTTPLETERCSENLKRRLPGRTDFKSLVLHGQVQPEEQQLVFQQSPAGVRKIVFATNSAETSITIPGIKYVIDTGLVKEKRYDARRNMSSLSVVQISRSSADQRKGRAGRTGPGRCYRLYSQEIYQNMEAVSQPEILKVHLGQAMLKLAELGIDPLKYDFVQSPGHGAISAAMDTLEELGAIRNNKITDEGRELAKLPLEPRLGLLIQKGKAEGALFDAIVLAAVSSMGSSIFYRGGSDEDKKKADKLKVKFCHPGGDSMTLLNVFRKWIEQPEKKKAKWCFDNSINSKSIKAARETVNEITTVLKKGAKITVKHELLEPDQVDGKLQRILFDCFLANICHHLGLEKGGYFAIRRDQQVHAHPSTALNPLGITTEWLVFEQSLKTSKDFITGLTPVQESWVVEAIESGRLKQSLEEMRNKKLIPVHIENVGSQMFFKIVGHGFSNLRCIQDEASALVKPALAVLEASRDKGEVKIYSTDNTNDKLSKIFQPVVEKVRNELEAEDVELCISQKNENAGIRVVLGQGGAVKDILMQDEYRTIFVDRPATDSDEHTILTKFSQFGKIKYHRMFKNPKRRWGCITYESPNDAKLAVALTRENEAEAATPETRGRGNQSSDTFKAKISWCRRKSKGFGFISVLPEDMPKVLCMSSMNIKNQLVTISVDRKNPDDLFLKNLGPDITEDDIKVAILSRLGYARGDTSILSKVIVVRERVDTENENLDEIREILEDHIENYAQRKRFKLNLLPPKPPTAFYRAFVTFDNAAEGIAACQGLSKQMYVGSRVVTMEPEIRSCLYVGRDVYTVVKEDLDEYLKIENAEVTIKQKVLRNGTLVLDLDSSDVLELARVRANLQEIVKGVVLECGNNPNLRHLFTRTGRDFLKTAEKKYGALVQVDNRNLSLSICGKKDACIQVNEAIEDFQQTLVEGEWKEIVLRGKDKPNGLMKELMNVYGLELEGLQEEAGLKSVILHFKQQVVKMSGPTEKIDQGVSIIKDISLKLFQGQKTPAPEEEDLPDCCICWCPVEPKDLYRLEYCGHAYCLDCLKRQVECALKDKELPLKCGQQDCSQTFMWRDVMNISKRGSCTMSDIMNASVSSYVVAHPQAFQYCLTPDCGMVYKITSSGSVFVCPECQIKICTSCLTQAHEGLTCAMVKSAKEDEGNLDVFLANAPNTKKCPNCTTPIEKIDGCNNMHCEACKCSFCWLCCKHFKDSQACYAHLATKHGGFQ